MELSNIIGACCLATSIPQGIVAFRELVQRSKKNNVDSQETNSLTLAVLLLLATILTVLFAGWIFFSKPFQPRIQIVTVERVVEKPTPCPITQQKNGTASARGGQIAVAHSGSNDSNSFDQPDKPKQKDPK